jgi:SPX domain protein involved in polyphosphate accumulation
MLPRYECKYVVSPLLVPDMRAFLRSFTVPDPYSAEHAEEDYRYTVCSLYLDSPDLRLYGQTVGGEKRRFKLRIRFYSDNPDESVFPEIKRRENTILQKTRTAISRDRLSALMAGRSDEAVCGLPEPAREAVESFQYLAGVMFAEPVIRVRYSREAWIAASGEPVRITFDTNVMQAVTLDDTLSCTAGDWQRVSTGGTILKIKFTERFPFWVHEMITMFGLIQRSVPKYVMSVDEVLARGGGAALRLGGFTLPPYRQGQEITTAPLSLRRFGREEE